MILLGIAATPDGVIDGMTLLPGAIDCTQLVPLYHNHEREIGRVLALQYRNGKLLVTAETDDPVAASANFMSPCVKALAHHQQRVTAARLVEVSLTSYPKNRHCRILERRTHDPIRELCRVQNAFYTLVQQRVGVLQKMVPLLAMGVDDKPKPQNSFRSLVEHLNRGASHAS